MIASMLYMLTSSKHVWIPSHCLWSDKIVLLCNAYSPSVSALFGGSLDFTKILSLEQNSKNPETENHKRAMYFFLIGKPIKSP